MCQRFLQHQYNDISILIQFQSLDCCNRLNCRKAEDGKSIRRVIFSICMHNSTFCRSAVTIPAVSAGIKMYIWLAELYSSQLIYRRTCLWTFRICIPRRRCQKQFPTAYSSVKLFIMQFLLISLWSLDSLSPRELLNKYTLLKLSVILFILHPDTWGISNHKHYILLDIANPSLLK